MSWLACSTLGHLKHVHPSIHPSTHPSIHQMLLNNQRSRNPEHHSCIRQINVSSHQRELLSSVGGQEKKPFNHPATPRGSLAFKLCLSFCLIAVSAHPPELCNKETWRSEQVSSAALLLILKQEVPGAFRKTRFSDGNSFAGRLDRQSRLHPQKLA